MKIFIKTREELKTYEAETPVAGIGRGPENEVVIDDPRASRNHCRVEKTDSGYLLVDLDSRNGVSVQGKKVQRAELSAGDTFQIGKTLFILETLPAKTSRKPAASSPGAGAESESPSKARALTTEDAYLEGLKGTHQGQRIPITKLPYTIGRKPDNDFRLEDQRASGYHVRILRRDGVFYVEDLKSRNGTVLNGKKVSGEQPLQAGARLQVGDSQFRVQVPGGPPAEPAYDDPAAAYELSRFNVDEFTKSSSAGQPLVALGLVVVLGALLYFAVDIALKVVARRNVDPNPDTNSLRLNWSFEDEIPEGAVLPGWRVADEGASMDRSTRDGVRYPGEKALQFRSTAPDDEAPIARVVYEERLPVTEGETYHFSGYVLNRSSLAAGLVVTWLRQEGDRFTVMGTTYSPAIDRPGDEGRLGRAVIAPESITHAEVGLFVLGGEAFFDRIYFSSEPFAEDVPDLPLAPELADTPEGDGEGEAAPVAEKIPAPTYGEPLPLVASGSGESASNSGPAIRARLRRDGVIAGIRRGVFAEITELWPGLPPGLDPLGIGPRLTTHVIPGQSRDVHRLTTQLPDFVDRLWRPVDIQVQINGGSISIQHFYRKVPGEELPPEAGIYLELGSRDPVWKAFAESGLIELDRGRPESEPVKELVIGQGDQQVVCQFTPALRLKLIEPTGSITAWRIFAHTSPESSPRNSLQVDLARSSGSEESAVRALIQEARELKREGDLARAISSLKVVQESYPWRRREVEQVQSLLEEWAREGSRSLESLQEDFEILKETGSPLVRANLLARGRRYLEQLAGSSVTTRIESLLAEVEQHWEGTRSQRESRELLVTFELAEKHYVEGQFSLAEFYFREIQGRIEDTDIAAKIDRRLELLETKKAGRARLGD